MGSAVPPSRPRTSIGSDADGSLGAGSRQADAIDVHIGGRIRTARMMSGLSQVELAARMGVSFQQLQKYERGHNRISVSRLHQAARHLGLSVSWFWVGLEAEPDAPVSLVRETTVDQMLAFLEAPGTVGLARDLIRLDPRARAEVTAFVRLVVETRQGR